MTTASQHELMPIADAPSPSADGWERPRPDVQEPLETFLRVAREKLGNPAWQWYAIKRIGQTNDALLTGGVPNQNARGRARWRGVPKQEVVVTESERETARRTYEAETGQCAECQGVRTVCCGVSVAFADGTRYKYRACSRCVATGAHET